MGPPGVAPQILLVDDDPAQRRLLEAMLGKHGFSARHADNGRAALRELGARDVDIVLLDAMMPGLDGFDTCRAIRGDDPLLPVIMVTGLTDDLSRIRGKKAGADDFLCRPFVEEELIARINALLAGKRAREAVAEELRSSQRAARRWRIASLFAENVSPANTLEEFRRILIEVLAEELPVQTADCGFVGEPGCPPEIALLAVKHTGARPLFLDNGSFFLPFVERGRIDGGIVIRLEPATLVDLELMSSLLPHIQNAAARLRLLRTEGELAVARERLTSLVVHDLKNPLTVVRANLELLRDAQMAAEERLGLDDAINATEQLLGMLLDLLDVGRVEVGALTCCRRDADVGVLVRRTVEPFRPLIERQPASFDVSVPDAVVTAAVDEGLLQRVIQNLLVNASRFVPPSGVVAVALEASEADVVISVSNDGPHIPDDVLAHLFDKYGQLTAGQGYANRGLGLYLCRLVVDGHGGTIGAENLPERGARFSVTIPRE